MRSSAPEDAESACLLLVHVRKVVGRVTYRTCDLCAEGVVTGVVLDEPFRGCGLGTRALSHLRAQYPDLTWRTTLDNRFTRDLLRRMRIPKATQADGCSHHRSAVAQPGS